VEIPGLAKLIKSSTEQRQASDYIISLNQQHCLADVAQGEPGIERMLSRMVDQHRDKAFRCIQIADKKGDWARSVGQRITQRKRIIDC
jgi:hypothetical protein